MPARSARHADWPSWTDPQLRVAYERRGVVRPWAHQVEAADAAHGGRHVVLATATASGKSLAFLLPALTAIRDRELSQFQGETKAPSVGAGGIAGSDGASATGERVRAERATALYLAPTKALAADQFAGLERLVADGGLAGVRPAVFDGDTPTEERRWIRRHANYVLTNPDMLHHGILPGHEQWATFLRALRYVVVDECHSYRGVFGAHVALILRRLRRIARRYGTDPIFILASATVADPALSASRLVGADVFPVTEDGSPRHAMAVGLWEPALVEDSVASASASVENPVSASQPDADTAAPAGDTVGGPEAESAADRAADQATGRGADASSGGKDACLPPIRRSATAETSELLADLVSMDIRTLAFARARRTAELIATTAGRSLGRRADLGDLDPGLLRGRPSGRDVRPERLVAAYRGGYLPEERRALERALRTGELLGLASTNALELGIDIAGLEAILISGWPGTRASLWQMAGRAGRHHVATDADAPRALVLFIARDDPLDTYVVHHPEAVFGQPVEASVFDPENAYVLAPHLCAAASEIPIAAEEAEFFGSTARELLDLLAERGALRRRSSGWFWTSRERAHDLADLRGSGGQPVRIVELVSGALIGTIDAGGAHEQVHDGAVYVHQGETFVVNRLDVEDAIAFVTREEPLWTTSSRGTSQIDVLARGRTERWGEVELTFGSVEVRDQVVGYQVRDVFTGAVLGNHALDLPERSLRTRAVWWTIPDSVLEDAGIEEKQIPGALHAAEHAAIGLLPLMATCDRWDIGGVSTALHADTERATIFVYDGQAGGAGFAERGFHVAREWLAATLVAVSSCECDRGCPSCVQSPKCGNGNEPLDKRGAIVLLGALVSAANEGAAMGTDSGEEAAPDAATAAGEQRPGIAADSAMPEENETGDTTGDA